jgi:hypothetical protein
MEGTREISIILGAKARSWSEDCNAKAGRKQAVLYGAGR